MINYDSIKQKVKFKVHGSSIQAFNVLNVSVTDLKSYQHAEDAIIQRIREKNKTFCVAVNPEKIYRAQDDPTLRQLINSADLQICDGIGAAIAVRTLYGKKIPRITGVQLFLNLMARAEKEGLKVFLLGARPESNEGAYLELKNMYPDLRIVGRQDGYFQDEDNVVAMINDKRPDMLFVAMGSPRQEEWISTNKEKINATFLMGVGGTLDVLSGHAQWAPKLFRKTGTEWLYRLAKEPKRLKRQLVLPKFALKVIQAKFSGNSQ